MRYKTQKECDEALSFMLLMPIYALMGAIGFVALSGMILELLGWM